MKPIFNGKLHRIKNILIISAFFCIFAFSALSIRFKPYLLNISASRAIVALRRRVFSSDTERYGFPQISVFVF